MILNQSVAQPTVRKFGAHRTIRHRIQVCLINPLSRGSEDFLSAYTVSWHATAFQAPARLHGSRRGAIIASASLDISTVLFNAGQQADSLVLDQLQGEKYERASKNEAAAQ
jgi:hypothetical protein